MLTSNARRTRKKLEQQLWRRMMAFYKANNLRNLSSANFPTTFQRGKQSSSTSSTSEDLVRPTPFPQTVSIYPLVPSMYSIQIVLYWTCKLLVRAWACKNTRGISSLGGLVRYHLNYSWVSARALVLRCGLLCRWASYLPINPVQHPLRIHCCPLPPPPHIS